MIAKVTKLCLFCMFKSEKAIQQVQSKIQPANKPLDLKPENVETNLPPVTSEPLVTKLKCNFCNKCEECLNQVKKEKQEKQEQAELKSNLSALNILAFILLFLFILTCNCTIWNIIGS